MNILIGHAAKAAGIGLVLAGALAACGGGGDDSAGSLTDFSIQPAATTFTAPVSVGGASVPANTCLAGGVQDVYVYGGAAPYRIDNTSPAYISIDKTSVDSRGGHFTVTVTSSACFTKATVVIVDHVDRQVLYTVDNSPNTGGT